MRWTGVVQVVLGLNALSCSGDRPVFGDPWEDRDACSGCAEREEAGSDVAQDGAAVAGEAEAGPAAPLQLEAGTDDASVSTEPLEASTEPGGDANESTDGGANIGDAMTASDTKICGPGYRRCDALCIGQDECCSDADCNAEASCSDERVCVCKASSRLCGEVGTELCVDGAWAGECTCNSESQPCGEGGTQQCASGNWGICDECTPGAEWCEGNDLYRCSVIGQEELVQACAGDTPRCEQSRDSAACVCQPTTWHLDLDGDGVGGATDTQQSCTPPTPAHVPLGGDCCDSGSGADRVFPRAADDEAPFSTSGATGCALPFDFDCDGEETRDTKPPFDQMKSCSLGSCTTVSEPNNTPCGAVYTPVDCMGDGGGSCSARTDYNVDHETRGCR